MRKIFYALPVLFLISCNNDSSEDFEVTGKIKNSNATTVYLEEVSLLTMQPTIVDTAKIGEDGSFELETISKEETIFSLRLEGEQFPAASFINDVKKINVTVDANNEKEGYTVSGSSASQALKEYMYASGEKIRSIYNLDQEINSLRASKATDSIINIKQNERKNLVEDLRTYTLQSINKARSPALALFTLGSYQSAASNPAFGLQGFTQPDVNKMITDISNKFPSHSVLQNLKNSIVQNENATAANTSALLNKQAPDFTLPDVNGKPVALSSFKGKYVLVDFWASWCPPCREENPNLVQAYQNFKDKNFTILGVSLDRPGQKDQWLNAIKNDNLTWTQVSDLKFWNSMVVPLYNIGGIPYSVLVDPNGVVIAENLRGEELERKLGEVLK